ncbi:MAG: hypothetical protein KC495_11040 [Dehalococcoidia bacterium]|nr:hypothetical protein [Dehalococcoidia bacterium]
MRWKEMPGGFAAFERELHERVQAFERGLIAEAMACADIDTEAITVDGTVYRKVVRAEETYMSAAGEVSVMRTLYKDRTNEAERAIVPMELRLGVVEGFWTPEAAKQAAWVVSQMTPKLGEELFVRMGHMRPSKSSLDRLPKALSDRWEDERLRFEQTLRETEVVPANAVSMAVSLDGVLVPMKDGGATEKRQKTAENGQLTRGPAGYREVGVGTLSFYDAEGEMLSAIRIGRMPEHKKATLKRWLKAEVSAMLDKHPDLQLVKLADGANDNWTFLAKDLPAGIELVDFFHAAQHLNEALGVVYGKGSVQTQERFEDLRFRLKETPDGVESVIRALAYLHKKHPKKTEVLATLKFFRRRRHRMRYQEVGAQNLPIGSGIVEAACKTLASQRLKLSGMQWGEEGGQAILTLRGWSQSGDRFDRAWALLAATYQAEVITMRNVVPFPVPATRKPAG